MDVNKGTVFWITGLPGAGKSTIAKLLCSEIEKSGSTAILLDGDELRKIFGDNAGYSNEERRVLAARYGRLCKMLSDQGVDVVCATVSMFHNVREWNRVNIQRYKEVYIKVPIEVLIDRDQKGIYSRALDDQEPDVLGINLEFEEPRQPDIVLENGNGSTLESIINQLLIQLQH